MFDIRLTSYREKRFEVVQICSPICKPTIVAFHALDYDKEESFLCRDHSGPYT
jgi:hypothetical protein